MSEQQAVHQAWQDVKAIHQGHQLTLGPRASYEMLTQPEHVAMLLSRYRAAAALIGNASNVLEIGAGEGLGAAILGRGRLAYRGIDNDAAAIEIARRNWAPPRFASLPEHFEFDVLDATAYADLAPVPWLYRGVVLLDVIEHIQAEFETRLMLKISRAMSTHGVCVVGTPNEAAHHLASEASRVGHINLYSHDRLFALMERYFERVLSFGMQDTSLHLGHPGMRHYLLFAGMGPKEMQPGEGSFA